MTAPIKSPALRADAIKRGRCPECGGQLDTGWECNDCEFDCRPELPASWKAEIAHEKRHDR